MGCSVEIVRDVDAEFRGWLEERVEDVVRNVTPRSRPTVKFSACACIGYRLPEISSYVDGRSVGIYGGRELLLVKEMGFFPYTVSGGHEVYAIPDKRLIWSRRGGVVVYDRGRCPPLYLKAEERDFTDILVITLSEEGLDERYKGKVVELYDFGWSRENAPISRTYFTLLLANEDTFRAKVLE